VVRIKSGGRFDFYGLTVLFGSSGDQVSFYTTVGDPNEKSNLVVQQDESQAERKFSSRYQMLCAALQEAHLAMDKFSLEFS
jgi:hypothetical protein